MKEEENENELGEEKNGDKEKRKGKVEERGRRREKMVDDLKLGILVF